MKHELPDLPYAMDALAPHVSEETLEYHWGKHHRKYVDNLNGLIEGTEFEDSPLDEIVANAGAGDLFNNAAQTWNHGFYWRCMSPDGGGRPTGALAEAIDSSFESFDAFREAFTEAGKKAFGSAWVWLIDTGSGVVSIETTPNAETPLMHGRVALLTCDVWEHAYYIDYRNDKASYLDAFWEIVNWDFVASRLRA
jgi:Fe-Mn family superoxide dismutase